jgi:deoxycytidine triphosphate deaminase/intein/homing endonuclease
MGAAASACRLPRVVLSDRSIREELASGGIVIDPLDENAIQPSSVDVHVDRYFRVFRNDTTPYIDPKRAQEDLTELVEVEDDKAFILHPGEFVLGSTRERVALGTDLVARLEGKSSLGRLGLLIHSSLPASESVMVLTDEGLEPRPIGEIVRKRLRGHVVAFDPDTFEVGYHQITGWYEGPPDRIYEVRLASGRRLRVTAGHNVFTLDRDGNLAKARTRQLRPGTRVAIPKAIPDPPRAGRATKIDLLSCIPEGEYGRLMCTGPTIARAFDQHQPEIRRLFREANSHHLDYYRARARLPLAFVARVPGLLHRLTASDALSFKQGKDSFPRFLSIDPDLGWLLGLYVAEGSRRATQFTIRNTDQPLLDRVESILMRLGVSVYRGKDGVTGCSAFMSELLGWLRTGAGAHTKQVPPLVFGWPRMLVSAFFEGLIDGDGSRDDRRISLWTCSDRLAMDALLLAERLGLRAGSSLRQRKGGGRLWQIYFPRNEHKLLTSVPVPDGLLVEIRRRAGITLAAASRLAGYRNQTDLWNIENRYNRHAVQRATLGRLRAAYIRRPECAGSLSRLDRLVDGDLLWDRVVEVRDTGEVEPIFDLEIQPRRRKIENFLAGDGGVFAANTAGFVDAGWDGHLTLELSNVANLPIAIYPGMKIGQISFLRMTSEAETPYGSETAGSKYKGQRGPTPSRYYLNFERDD